MKIAAVLTNGFEDSEYFKPIEAFKKKGHEIVNIGLKKNIIEGKKGKKTKIDITFDKAQAKNYDAILIPGGHSPDKLRAHKEAVSFVKKFSKKPIFSICHGPQLLITANMIKGRKITGYKSIKQDIKNAGAKFFNKSVVVDNNLVSSRNPKDIPDFIKASLKLIE